MTATTSITDQPYRLVLQVNPIAFTLSDEQQQGVIYITNDARPLTLEILNTSGKALTIPTFTKGTSPDYENHHFELRFRPGTLSQSCLNNPDEKKNMAVQCNACVSDKSTSSGWVSSKATQNSDNTISFFIVLTGATNTVLNYAESNADALGTSNEKPKGESLSLILNNVVADAANGARGSRLELRYQNLQGPNPTKLPDGHLSQAIEIVNQRGQKHIPLHARLVGGNRVLNDGQSGTTLTLRLTNMLRNLDSPLNPSTINLSPAGKAATKLILSFDTGDSNVGNLGTTAEAKEITIEISTPQNEWKPIGKAKPNGQGISAEWIFTNVSQKTLTAGESIEFDISNIVTGQPAGLTNCYIRYENIPGYWDGQFVCVIEKCPLLFLTTPEGTTNVGIGTASPLGKLHVAGDVNVDKTLSAQNITAAINASTPGTVVIGMNTIPHGAHPNPSGLNVLGRLTKKANPKAISYDTSYDGQGFWLDWNHEGGEAKTRLINNAGRPGDGVDSIGAFEFWGANMALAATRGNPNPTPPSQKLLFTIKNEGTVLIPGNVGIGPATTPATTLHVGGNTRIEGDAYIGGAVTIDADSTTKIPLSLTTTYGDKIALWNADDNSHILGFGIQANTLQIKTNVQTDDIVFGYGDTKNLTETMRIKGTGMVGIGANSDDSIARRLHIFTKEPNDGVCVQGNTSTFYIATNNVATDYNPITQEGDIVLSWNNPKSTKASPLKTPGLVIAPNIAALGGIRVDENGKIGIGAAEPTATLDVAGDVHVSGPLTLASKVVFGFDGAHLTITQNNKTFYFGDNGTWYPE